MEIQLTLEDNQRIRDGIQEKYRKVASNPEGLFNYPTGRAGLETLGYSPKILNSLPDEICNSYCGVGNPFSLGEIKEGDAVLDIGCGVGIDLIFAAKIVVPSGRVVGVEMVSEMLDQGKRNIKTMGLENVTFVEGSVEKLNLPDDSFDVVISNGVFNLIPNKEGAVTEVFRLLKPGGRFMIADQVLVGVLQKDLKSRIDSWFQWEGGAVPGKDFLEMIRQAGFENEELVAETGFNSSPKTKGVLIRAVKPSSMEIGMEKEKPGDSLSKYQEFFDRVYTDEVIDRKTKHLIALGASLAAGCDPWTRHSLAVARELGATEEELDETMAVAMTVGATKIKILQENTLKNLSGTDTEKIQAAEQPDCSTWNS